MDSNSLVTCVGQLFGPGVAQRAQIELPNQPADNYDYDDDDDDAWYERQKGRTSRAIPTGYPDEPKPYDERRKKKKVTPPTPSKETLN